MKAQMKRPLISETSARLGVPVAVPFDAPRATHSWRNHCRRQPNWDGTPRLVSAHAHVVVKGGSR